MRMLFGLLCLALLGYEGLALWTTAPGDTISEIMWQLGQRPLVPFALGFLMGHFFWQRRP